MSRASSSRVASAIARRQTAAVATVGSAREAIAGIGPGCAVFGVSKGQFSLIDLVMALLELSGPGSAVSVWTWAIAEYELQAFEDLMRADAIGSLRLICDFATVNRYPEHCRRMVETWGPGSIRIVKSHAKIATVDGGGRAFVARGSMNLNSNRRFEQFDVTDCPDVLELVRGLEHEIEALTPAELERVTHESAARALNEAMGERPSSRPTKASNTVDAMTWRRRG